MRVQLGFACLAAFLALPAGTALARSPSPSKGYIVVYERSVRDVSGETTKRERAQGFKARFRYRHAVKGFAAKLSPGQVRKLRNDPDVAFVSPDRTVHALATAPLASGETAPTGVRRMEAVGGGLARAGSSANVAVIDTGINLSH